MDRLPQWIEASVRRKLIRWRSSAIAFNNSIQGETDLEEEA
ncbi:hypothetical protein V6Z12_A07G010900 [Gossypium hirsutum]